MLTDHRVQIYLPDEIYRAAAEMAKAQNKPFASIVREAMAAYMVGTEKDRIREGYRLMDDIVGIGVDIEGKTDVSENHQKYFDDIIWEDHLKKTGQTPP